MKLHFKTMQGIRTLPNAEAARLIGDDPETHQRDLHPATSAATSGAGGS